MLNVLTDVADGLEGALLHHLGAGGVGHVLDQGCDESRPQCSRYLHSSDHVDTLSCSAGSEALSAQSSHHILLGVGADVLGNVEPPLLVLSLQGLVVSVEEVLELDSGLLSAHCTVPSVIQHIRQSPTSRLILNIIHVTKIIEHDEIEDEECIIVVEIYLDVLFFL